MRLQTYLPRESDTPLTTHTPSCTRLLCMYGHRCTRPNWWRRSPLPPFLGLESKSWSCSSDAAASKGAGRDTHAHIEQHTSSSRLGTVTTCVRVRAQHNRVHGILAWARRSPPPHFPTVTSNLLKDPGVECHQAFHCPSIRNQLGSELCRHQAGPT